MWRRKATEPSSGWATHNFRPTKMRDKTDSIGQGCWLNRNTRRGQGYGLAALIGGTTEAGAVAAAQFCATGRDLSTGRISRGRVETKRAGQLVRSFCLRMAKGSVRHYVTGKRRWKWSWRMVSSFSLVSGLLTRPAMGRDSTRPRSTELMEAVCMTMTTACCWVSGSCW